MTMKVFLAYLSVQTV